MILQKQREKTEEKNPRCPFDDLRLLLCAACGFIMAL